MRSPGAILALTDAVRALAALSDAGARRVDDWSLVALVERGTDEWIVARRISSPTLRSKLSKREHQVVGLLLLGWTPKVVAYELGIAHSTVRVLVSRALAKLGVRSAEDVRRRFGGSPPTQGGVAPASASPSPCANTNASASAIRSSMSAE
jgi:DNA-binding NarL/FixJ family response regulator